MTTEETQTWVDKSALTELVARLSAAVDRADKAAIIDCYAPQSYDDHGGFKGSGSEFADMICAPAGRAEQLTMHHLLGQSVFDVDGDEGWGETFFVMHALIGGQVTAGYGRYIDYFQRFGRCLEAHLPKGRARRHHSRRRCLAVLAGAP